MWWISRFKNNHKVIEYVFFIFLLFDGIDIAYEGTFFNEYKFYEIWLLYYSIFLIISIASCFQWKRMVLLFWFVKIFNFIVIHYTYKSISLYFYCGYVFVIIFLPLIWMIAARIILGFILTIYKNQELAKTIKNILKIFPESIIIQSIDEKSDSPIIQFVNDSAIKDIIDYDDPVGKPIINERLQYILAEVKHIKDSESSNQHGQETNTYSLSELLQYHIDLIEIKDKVVLTSIELHSKAKPSNFDILHFNVKSMKVKWGSYK